MAHSSSPSCQQCQQAPQCYLQHNHTINRAILWTNKWITPFKSCSSIVTRPYEVLHVFNTCHMLVNPYWGRIFLFLRVLALVTPGQALPGSGWVPQGDGEPDLSPGPWSWVDIWHFSYSQRATGLWAHEGGDPAPGQLSSLASDFGACSFTPWKR